MVAEAGELVVDLGDAVSQATHEVAVSFPEKRFDGGLAHGQNVGVTRPVPLTTAVAAGYLPAVNAT